LLGESGTIFVAGSKAANALRGKFPQSLESAPMFLPTDNTALRRNLDFWFESNKIRPVVRGEFEDDALLRAFGETGGVYFRCRQRCRSTSGSNSV